MIETIGHAPDATSLDPVASLYTAGWFAFRCEEKSIPEEHGWNAGKVSSKTVFK